MLVATLSMFSFHTNAGAYSPWAIPTQIEYVNDGILVSGRFGNPNNCSDSDKIFISKNNIGDEKIFKSLLSILLSALTEKKKFGLDRIIVSM